jgi:hypothetical protein
MSIWTELHVFVYFPDDDIVEVEMCWRHVNDKWLFIFDCEMCLIKYCIIIYCKEYELHEV